MNIVLIDDEYISNFISKKLIENIDASIHVVEYNDPEEGFCNLHCNKPDVIFLDINMPVMSGWDFLDKMVAEKINYKVVVLTSSVNVIDRKMAARYNNIIGFIEKPATIASLKPIIAKVMEAVIN